jgi:hypothetical protein
LGFICRVSEACDDAGREICEAEEADTVAEGREDQDPETDVFQSVEDIFPDDFGAFASLCV